MDYRILFRNLVFSEPALPLTNRVSRHLAHLLTVLQNQVSDPRYNGEHWLVEELPQLGLVIDAGYNRGDFTDSILAHHPNARIHAFDPVPDAAECFAERHGQRTNLSFHDVALSNANGTADFFDYGKLNGCNSLVERKADFAAGAPVTITRVRTETLDDWAARHDITTIDLLKLDIEGYESHAITGAQRLFASQSVRALLFEYASGWLATGCTLSDCVHALNAHGYAVYRLFLGFLSPYEPQTRHEGRVFGMFVALPRGTDAGLPIRRVDF